MGRLLHEESRFRKVHLPGDGLEPAVVPPGGEEADRRRVAGQRAVGEGVNVKEGIAHRAILRRGFVVRSFPSIVDVVLSLAAPRQVPRRKRYERKRLPNSK